MNACIRERIIAVRKALNLNQRNFAKKLGIKQTTLSNVETGRNGMTDANTRLICVTFSVDENWLRSGIGTMFTSSFPGSPEETELLDVFRELLPPTRRVVLNHIKDLLQVQIDTCSGGTK
jgi:transcriptional regulator with XRE-family HTH domain